MPEERRDSEDLAADAEASAAGAGSHKILVVDDESGIRKGCQRVLRAEGHQVLTAETAEQALQIARRNPDTDLALIDLKMPGMGGLAFLARVHQAAPEVICVVITAYATLETAIEATKRGAYDLLPKPFTPDELLRIVRKALDRLQLVRERNRLQEERERRMLELATEQSRLHTIIDCMADAVLVCNADNSLVLYNPAALRVLPGLQPGRQVYKLGEALGSAELFEMVNEASSSHKRLSHEINLGDVPGGGWVLADMAPVLDQQSGQFLGTVTVLRDITELKRVEQVKAQFVNMVAHELRAPLAAVDGYMSVMQQGLAPAPEKQKQILGRSRQRLRSLLDLVSDLLDVARMEAGTVQREIGPQSLAQVVGEVMELMTPLAGQGEVTMAVEVPEGLPAVEADHDELVRLFTNLVSNAIKYNRKGGRVVVSAEQDGAYVKAAVADTGVGISEEGLKRLFTEFFREKQHETAYVTGTGLGLSIVKRIVDFYHGRIAAESRLGEGSTFALWLPSKFQAESAVVGEGPAGD